jgi:hypothetical protein
MADGMSSNGMRAIAADLRNKADCKINPATEDSLSQVVMAVNNAIDETAFDLNAAAFSEITNVINDYIFDSIELNFSTAEAKTITITSADGTILWGGDVDTTAANQGYLSTAKNIYLEFNRGFVANDNITVVVTQFSSAGTMDCILKTRSGSDTLIGSPHTGWIDTSGTEYGYQLAGSGRPRISTVPYRHEIAAGSLAGHISLPGFGERESVALPTGNIGIDVWGGVADVIPHPVVAGEQMTVVSTSAEDGVAGTGVLTIRIEYIDGNGEAQVEDITMNGLTPVNTVATDIAFVNHMFTTSRGSNGVALGNIDIYKLGDASTIYNRILAGGNKDLTIAIRVPANTTYFINEWHCAVTGNKPTAVRLRSTDWSGVLYDGDDPVFIFKDTAFIGEGNFDRDFDPPIKVPGGSTIKVSTWAQQAGAFITAGIGGFYE